jgi:murein DD-endopeptidase MepM/ murein hydrolase activator NlpD
LAANRSFLDRRGRASDIPDVGFEPPLDAGGKRHALHDHRRVSIRWLSATTLTGLSGAGLMAIAVLGAHDREADLGQHAQVIAARAPIAAERSVTSARKSDKLVRQVDILTAKQTFKTPTIVRSSDKEVIRVRTFSRVASPLLMTGGAYQDEIPAFNPLKLLTDSGNDRIIETAPQTGEEPDAEVSLVTTDLASHQLGADFAKVQLAATDVDAQVREAHISLRRPSASIIPPQMLLARTMRQPPEASAVLAYNTVSTTPFSGLDVRMVPENVTIIPKAEVIDTSPANDEKIVHVKKGEALEQLLRAQSVPLPLAKSAVQALNAGRERVAQEGQRLKLLFGALDGATRQRQLLRVMLYDEDKLEAIAAVTDRGNFVSVQPPQDDKRVESTDDDDEDGDNTSLQLFNSIYETALKNDVPRAVVDDLIRVLSSDSDTDFQRRVTGGDAFELFYTEDDDSESKDILFASLTIGGESKRYYRFVMPDDGSVDFFDENGRSARKFLMRKPILDGEMRSGFGMRRHPIMGYQKMHTGVDWANRVGTPILAAGNGTVIKAGWDSGYGRRVELQHANGYITSYSHLSGFGRNIQPGTRVRQGQVIGYLGSSGLSTGPHLHYEVIVNERYVDPMRIKVPRGRELDGRMLAEFRRERERIDTLIKKAPTKQRLEQSASR